MNYIPSTSIVYPERPDAHIIDVEVKSTEVFDEHYPYDDRRLMTRFMRGLIKVLLAVLGFVLMWFTSGIKIKGRDSLRKNRKLLKNGFVTVCNHVHVWDFVGIMLAFLRYKPNLPVWDKNMLGKDRRFVKWVGGIPVPKTYAAVKRFTESIDEMLKNKKWVHFYPEGSLWHYYPRIRPFKKGAFAFAVRAQVPVIPLAYTYREPRGIFRLLKKTATLTLHIGEPILPPPASADPHTATAELCRQARAEVMRLAGVFEESEAMQNRGNAVA